MKLDEIEKTWIGTEKVIAQDISWLVSHSRKIEKALLVAVNALNSMSDNRTSCEALEEMELIVSGK